MAGKKRGPERSGFIGLSVVGQNKKAPFRRTALNLGAAAFPIGRKTVSHFFPRSAGERGGGFSVAGDASYGLLVKSAEGGTPSIFAAPTPGAAEICGHGPFSGARVFTSPTPFLPITAGKQRGPELFEKFAQLNRARGDVAKSLSRGHRGNISVGSRRRSPLPPSRKMRPRRVAGRQDEAHEARRKAPSPAERAFESRLPRQCRHRVRGPRFTVSLASEDFFAAANAARVHTARLFSRPRCPFSRNAFASLVAMKPRECVRVHRRL